MSKKLKGTGHASIKQFLTKKPKPSITQVIQQEVREAPPLPSKKKFEGNLNAFIVKKPVEARPPEIVLYQCNELIDKLKPEELFEKVPVLMEFARLLQAKTEHKKCVKNLLISFLTQRRNSLWSSKYTPKDLNGVFHQKTVCEIQSWLKLFSNSRTSDEASDQDFEDSMNQQKRTQLLCSQKAMIVYGREGVGKMTLLKSIACSMNMEVHVCSNELDRFKYLKDKDENTKSECVKVRKGTPTPSVLLTDFLNKREKEDSVSSSQPSKVQIIHQINLIYPSQRRTKFHQDLIKLMRQSMIPFIFTSSEPTVPDEYKDFEKVEFKQLSRGELAQYFWLVYHVEACLAPLLPAEAIRKDSLFETLNECFKELTLVEHITMKQLEDIVQIMDFKLNRMFNFLQFRYSERTDFELFKKEALLAAIDNAEHAHIESMMVNIPSQHFSSNLNQEYRFTEQQEQSLAANIAALDQIIEADVLQCSSNQSSSMSPCHINAWVPHPAVDLSHAVIKHHYQILVRPEQKRVRSRLARMINHYQIGTTGYYSSLRPEEFPLVRPEVTRKQRRQTRQLLEQMVGVDYTRYLTHFSQLG